MFASVLAIALASFSAAARPAWHADYGLAQKLVKEEAKPIVVFIGSGEAGWNRVVRERELATDLRELLAKNYICVYVDTDLESGKQLASDFEVPSGLGLIVSDHTGRYQAFHHRGDLSGEQLAHYLNRYANPERIVRTTETNAIVRASYYTPYQPARYISSGSC